MTMNQNVQDVEVKTRSKVNLDTILVEEIGQFGKFQLRLLLLCIIPVIFTAWASSEYVFSTARISTRCLIPECDGIRSEFRPDWVSNAIPEGSGGLDNCHRYGDTSQPNLGESCPASLFNKTELIPCQEYVYENTDTVVYDFGLACSEWKRTMIGSIRTLATVVNLPLTGFISDHWGRRVALIVNTINAAWLGTMRYFSSSFIGFILSEFIETAMGSEVFSSAFILLLEITGPKYRVAAASALHAFFSLGQMLMGLIAWMVPNWRMFTLTLYTPMFICIAHIWLMSESVRWYLGKGKYEKLEKLLQRIAKTNGRTLSPTSLNALKQKHEEEMKIKELEKTSKVKKPWLIVLIFRHKSILLLCIVTSIWSISAIFIFFGLTINAVNISGNKYTNYMSVAAVAIPGYIIAVYLMEKIGRKPVILIFFWLCSVFMAAYIFLPDGYRGTSLIFYLLSKTCIACVAATLYVYTMEVFPTEYRHRLFAVPCMMGRIGSIAAPFTPALGVATFDKFPYVLFGSFALISGFLTFLVPETFGVTLPDTLEEAANLGKKQENPF